MRLKRKKEDALFWFLVGIVILIASIIWLGNDIGLWQVSFPFWPIVAILVGIAILATAVEKYMD